MDAATRLWLLIEKLLDLSLLQAGRLEPRRSWCSIEEVLHEAIEQAGDSESSGCRSSADLPLLRGDPAQLERAFANVLENAARYSAGKPVVGARPRGGRAHPGARRRPGTRHRGERARARVPALLPFHRRRRTSHHGSASAWRSPRASSRSTAGAYRRRVRRRAGHELRDRVPARGGERR